MRSGRRYPGAVAGTSSARIRLVMAWDIPGGCEIGGNDAAREHMGERASFRVGRLKVWSDSWGSRTGLQIASARDTSCAVHRRSQQRPYLAEGASSTRAISDSPRPMERSATSV